MSHITKEQIELLEKNGFKKFKPKQKNRMRGFVKSYKDKKYTIPNRKIVDKSIIEIEKLIQEANRYLKTKE